MNFMTQTIESLKKLLIIYILFLSIMTIFRIVFFFYYNELNELNAYGFDISKMLFLGFRIDLTVVGYIQVVPTLLLIALYYLKKEYLYRYFQNFLKYYLFLSFLAVAILLIADFGFYSYFKDHINILFFGLFEDDTFALLETFWQNYNVLWILFVLFLCLSFLFLIIDKVLKRDFKKYTFFVFRAPWLFFALLLLFNFFIIRGTFGMYPLGKMIPNVSQNDYINSMSQNGVRAFISAYGIRKDYLSKKIDYIKETGFENNISEAFKIHKNSLDIDEDDLLNNITYKTNKIDDEDYNVVIIMVESFGLPILKYQSSEFDIMGKLKKHFDEDILFTNIISEGDGTISSLEALLLNIPYRPKSFAFSQSDMAQTSFDYSPAFLYNDANYNTTFIYGGDLTWRDLGEFIRFQGYKNIEGKQDIYSSLIAKEDEDYFHPWGIYDEYLYEYILKKLENSKEKEMILALSTNNHPPYNIPNDYKSKIISYSEELKKSVIGDFDLAQQRFKSYAYALDSIGDFLDKFKKSNAKENTIVVITADNNTVEGIMKYSHNPIFTSKNIPIYFYLPEKLKEKLDIDTTVAGSQKDIFPTLYNLTLDNKQYISIGSNLFDERLPHYGFNGSMIVNSGEKVRKLKSLKEQSSDDLINYYKASLAVTEYLLNIYKEGEKK